ncbi:MAG: chorismate synthase, partial [Calditrichaeota bacterium]
MRFYTAGESHGQKLVGILEGLPANLPISIDEINHDLQRRQQGYGRGRRMKIESDRAIILSGIRFGKTLGSPIAIEIENRDWKNWEEKMAILPVKKEIKKVTVPRPGHADLAGAIKYQQSDIRNILERASARETAMRVALANLCKQLLQQLNIIIASHVVQIDNIVSPISFIDHYPDILQHFPPSTINTIADASEVRVLDKSVEKKMKEQIDLAKKEKDTLGGIFEVLAFN